MPNGRTIEYLSAQTKKTTTHINTVKLKKVMVFKPRIERMEMPKYLTQVILKLGNTI